MNNGLESAQIGIYLQNFFLFFFCCFLYLMKIENKWPANLFIYLFLMLYVQYVTQQFRFLILFFYVRLNIAN